MAKISFYRSKSIFQTMEGPGEKALQGNWYVGLLLLIMIISDRLWVQPVAPPPPTSPTQQFCGQNSPHFAKNFKFVSRGWGGFARFTNITGMVLTPLTSTDVTALALYILTQRAYPWLSRASFEESPELFEEWKKRTIEASPLFHYRHLVVELELTVATFVQSLRQGDFVLYCNSLKSLVSLLERFFALMYNRTSSCV